MGVGWALDLLLFLFSLYLSKGRQLESGVLFLWRAPMRNHLGFGLGSRYICWAFCVFFASCPVMRTGFLLSFEFPSGDMLGRFHNEERVRGREADFSSLYAGSILFVELVSWYYCFPPYRF